MAESDTFVVAIIQDSEENCKIPAANPFQLTLAFRTGMMTLSATHRKEMTMDEHLLQTLSALSEEEKALLAGQPLRQSTYTRGSAFVVASGKLLPPQRLITLRPHTRFAAFPLHSHDYVEILYMITGSTTHDIPGREPLTVRAGELLLMNSQAQHSIRRCGEGDVGVNFIVQPAFFDEALTAVGSSNTLGRFLIDALKRGESAVPYLHFQVADVPSIQSLLESMLHALTAPQPAGQRILKAAMTLLFLQLLEQTSQLSLPPSGASALVVAVLDEIQHSYATISFRDFAAARHVSPAYLSQIVRKATGMSCTEHLQQQRLAQARKLLRETDLTVAEICAAVGYANTGHFYRLFESVVSLSPSAYRKLNSGRESI